MMVLGRLVAFIGLLGGKGNTTIWVMANANGLVTDKTRVLAGLLVRQAERIASEERSAARPALDLERVVVLGDLPEDV